MQRVIMKSKIQCATVTQGVLDSGGTYAVAPEIMHTSESVTPSFVHPGADNCIREQAGIA